MSSLVSFSGVSNQEWLSLLQRSVCEPFINGVEFPRFPHSSVQLGYNGAADEEGMLRAYGFWTYADGYARALGRPPGPQTRVLDVGCGWGRVTRLFGRDVPAENIVGIDIDPSAIVLSRHLGVPGHFIQTEANVALPFPDASFDIVVASSVLTHTPETVTRNLLNDFGRVTRSGGVVCFTVEDDGFFKHFDIPGIETSGGERWRLLSKHKNVLPMLKKRYSAGEYIYLNTNDEEVRRADIYGDALIPKQWIERTWQGFGTLVRFEVSAPPVYQAVVVLRRN
jgi:ubiquinone/menaquinone biosynthesis C-methylase UbiE